MSELLDRKQVAEKLGVSVQTIMRLITRGELAAYRVGAQYRIAAEAVNVLLDKSQTRKGEK